MAETKRIWFCKIGETTNPLPRGSDGPMRAAIAAAYKQITGEEPTFIFSGWGGELTEGERAVVDDVPVEEQLALHRFREATKARAARQ